MKKNNTSRHKLKRLRGHSAERLHNDPAFENVRKNWQDFTTAARSAKLLRTVMENIMEPVHDRSRQWRLTKAMSQVLRSDKSNPRGEYKPADGDLKLLINVELNTGFPFCEVFPESLLNFRIDKKKVRLNIWPIIHDSPQQHPLAATATDLEIRLAVADINFSQQSFNIKWASSGMLPFSDPGLEHKQLTVKLDKSSRLPLFLFLAINFYNEGFKERINAIKLVHVYTAEDECEDSAPDTDLKNLNF
ncbi:hypothetical protein [Chitinophaga sp. CF418]|uniref:hypothetical protein n=1 Tax=Chitinophaga sp. CF418 TaxID=1855287 RepID=UPI000914D23E|nr:hypothetical protein [Chitinophaga sp. CF418]SHN45718.1 hypothetical protein SAMN05216311_12130 [Chitinophaga sp. CF418]